MKVIRASAKWSPQHSIFLSLQVLVALVICWLWFHGAKPGWAVAILATVAAAMSVHAEMRGWQKAVWMVLIAALLGVELQAINKDRIEAQQSATDARVEQDSKFSQVLDTQKNEFQAIADGLRKTIANGQKTFNTVDATLKQTRPIARVQLDESDARNFVAVSNANAYTNVAFVYVNKGNADARNIWKMGNLLLGPSDLKQAEEVIMKELDIKWDRHLKISPGLILVPGVSRITTASPGFNDMQLQYHIAQGGFLYKLFRVKFTDDTGTYTSTECVMANSFAKEGETPYINCPFANTPRVRTK